jgi:ATP adenylyltransferase
VVYLKSEKPDECLFCRILKESDDEKNWIVHRGEHAFIVVNIYPYTNGHVMIVSNRHVENLNELNEHESTDMMNLLSRCEKAIIDAYHPHGINLGANLGRSAGAGIPEHLHLHIVPRWLGDTNFMTAIGETRVISEDLIDTYATLKTYF